MTMRTGRNARRAPSLDSVSVDRYTRTQNQRMPTSPLFSMDLNPTLGIPIYRQIMDAVREQIAAGLLRPGDRLPSIRELASHLRINPASAVKAYGELRHGGLITLDQGRGTFVSEGRSVAADTREELLVRELRALLHRAHALGLESADVLETLRKLVKNEAGDKKGSRK